MSARTVAQPSKKRKPEFSPTSSGPMRSMKTKNPARVSPYPLPRSARSTASLNDVTSTSLPQTNEDQLQHCFDEKGTLIQIAHAPSSLESMTAALVRRQDRLRTLLDDRGAELDELHMTIPEVRSDNIEIPKGAPWKFVKVGDDGEHTVSELVSTPLTDIVLWDRGIPVDVSHGPLAGWPCDNILQCSIKTPHMHTEEEVLTVLGSVKIAKALLGKPLALTASPYQDLQEHLEVPRVDNEALAMRSDRGLPNIQWRPCSMLDFGNTSTEALRLALPSIEDAELPKTASEVEQSLPLRLTGPHGRSRHSAHEQREVLEGSTKSSGKRNEEAQGSSKAVSDKPSLDVAATAAQLDSLSIEGNGESNRQTALVEERKDPIRDWFKRCGYL